MIPLSYFALDFGGAPSEGWPIFLGRRGIAIKPDFLGRDSIGHDAARRLFDERRADQLRAERLRVEQERQFIEADRESRAQLYKGIPWYEVPFGVEPAAAMLQAAKDDLPRRRSLADDFWNRDTPDAIPQVFGPTPGGE